MAVKLTPLHDRVIIKRIEEKESVKGGIIIPDTAKEKPQEGEVIAVGAGKLEKGQRIPLDVEVGDRILFGKYSGTDIKIEGEEYLILREEEILAKIGATAKAASARSNFLLRQQDRRTQFQRREFHSPRRVKAYGEANRNWRKFPPGDPAWCEHARRRREDHAGPQGPQCGHREEVRGAGDHQGRRDGGEGNRAEGPARKHGRADGARGGVEDLGRGR